MSKTIDYPSGKNGKMISAELNPPTGASNVGIVILAHGSEGMTDHLTGPWRTMILDYADELARLGFATLTPNYFEKNGATPEGIAADPTKQLLAGRTAWAAALADAVAHVKTLHGIDPARIGLLGFSLGGHLCLDIREMAKVLVAFYAPFPGLRPRGGRLALQAQLHNGTADKLVPPETAPIIEEMLKNEGATVDRKTYWGKGESGAAHGFIGTDAANTKAHADSKASALTFFTTHL